jgi:hypothetical protein
MQEVDRLYQVYTDEDGRLDEPSIWKDFREYLVADAERLVPDAVVAAYRERYDKQHRLRAQDLEQPSLPGFEGRYMPQLGSQPAVWMLRASREQLISWMSVEAAEHQVSVDAYALKTRRTAEWLAAWRPDHGDLGDVLRDLYP